MNGQTPPDFTVHSTQ